MIKYRLSKNVTVEPIENVYDVLPYAYLEGHFIMYDRNHDSEYIINGSINYYISKFCIYKSEREVLKEVENDVQSDDKKIREACSNFFKYLCKKNILVPGNKAERGIVNEPLYKKGDFIDGMHIQDVLSSRRYTDVYTVIDQTNGGSYVIKLLNSKKTITAKRFKEELADMEAEYKILQKTRHITAINKAYGFKKNQSKYAYLALEYIEGKSLSGYLDEEEEKGVLSHRDCLHIIEEIIKAFSCLHENNIIHGDIHASNILITKEKNARIIDLGMSRNVELEENELIKSGGVYFYMPPERINTTSIKKFSKEPDLFSDVYQVGVLIYLVLYNTLPFDGFTWEELAQSIKEINVTCPNISFLNHPVSPALVSIIQKCLHKDPVKRYRNASEVLSDFKNHSFAAKELMEI